MLDLLFKDKSEAFQTFKDFHALIEKQAQSKIGTLCTDNGKEYTSNAFEAYLRQHGIAHQTTVPYNPQQNGVAERMNRTIMNMVRNDVFQECKTNVLGCCSKMCSIFEK